MKKIGWSFFCLSLFLGAVNAFAGFYQIEKDVAPPSGPSDGKSLILVASGQGMGDDENMLFVDKTPSGDVEGYTYDALEVEPGIHLVWVYVRTLDKVTARWVSIQAGETKYLLFGRLGVKSYDAMAHRYAYQVSGAALEEITPDQFQTLLEGGKDKESFARLRKISLSADGLKEAAGQVEKNYDRASTFAGDPAGFPYQVVAAGAKAKLKVAAGLCAYADHFNPDQWTSAHVHKAYLAQVVNPSKKEMAGRLVVTLPGGSKPIESAWTRIPGGKEGILAAEAKDDIPWGKPFQMAVQLADKPGTKIISEATLDVLLPAAQKQVFEDKQKTEVLLAGPVKINGLGQSMDPK